MVLFSFRFPEKKRPVCWEELYHFLGRNGELVGKKLSAAKYIPVPRNTNAAQIQ